MPPRYPQACDCHIHVYENRFPFIAGANVCPPPDSVDAYLHVQDSLGLTRVIVVQPTGYGFDNRCTLDALKQFGAEARGIVVVPTDVSDDELLRLHEAGVRGIRYMTLPGGGLLPWESLTNMAARIAPLGWNINLQLDGRELPSRHAMLSSLRCRLVIEVYGFQA